MDIGTAVTDLQDLPAEESDENEEDEDDDEILQRAKDAQSHDFPLCFANMNDIKSKFEAGISDVREEKREERKQEIQSIRSRLFQGKQAKFKEMYQQAVAESEQSK